MAQPASIERIALPPQQVDGTNEIHYFKAQIPVPGVIELVQASLSIPTELATDQVALVGPGFSAVKAVSSRFRHEVAQEGIPAISWEPSRGRSGLRRIGENLFDAQAVHYDTYEAVANYVATSKDISKLPNARDIRESLLAFILHSMANKSGSDFMRDNPEIVKTGIHMAGVGDHGRLGFDAVPAALNVLATDVIPGVIQGKFGYRPNLAYKTGKYLLRNPFQTAGEIGSCIVTDNRATVAEIAANGTYQAYIGFKKEGFFPTYKVLIGIGAEVDFAEIMDDLPHTGPQREPRRVAGLAAMIIKDHPTALTQLELIAP